MYTFSVFWYSANTKHTLKCYFSTFNAYFILFSLFIKYCSPYNIIQATNQKIHDDTMATQCNIIQSTVKHFDFYEHNQIAKKAKRSTKKKWSKCIRLSWGKWRRLLNSLQYFFFMSVFYISLSKVSFFFHFIFQGLWHPEQDINNDYIV